MYAQRPLMREGNLSRLRAQFICQENLSKAAYALNLHEYLISDHSMRASGSNKSKAVLSDALEAIFGAVFLDGGLLMARQVIFKVLGFPSLDLLIAQKDAKTTFQEIIQLEFREAPKYVLLGKQGPAHAPVFKVGIKVQDLLIASAEGNNKKVAAHNAAVLALRQWQIDNK
jgi:ribonuclease-3